MKIKPFAVILTLALTLNLASCFGGGLPTAEQSAISETMSPEESRLKRETIKYLAFGDSIARGAALADPETTCYPIVFSRLCADAFDLKAVQYQNLAVDGQNTGELLELLKTQTDEISDADLITISIGANNVLGVFLGHITDIASAYNLPQTLFSDAGTLFYEVFSGIAEPHLYQNVVSAFTEIETYVNSELFEQQISDAAQKLEADLPQIITAIRSANPHAAIVLNTIYNPYKNLNIGVGSLNLFSPAARTQTAVNALNKVITENAEGLGYILAPVFDVFESYTDQPRLENAFFDFLKPGETDLDVHPTKDGHKIIAQTVFDAAKDRLHSILNP